MSGSYSSAFSTAFDAAAAGWVPGDPWPPAVGASTATPGGVAHPKWGGYIRFWLLVEIEAGRPFTLGPHANARLDHGNVLTGPGVMARDLPVTGDLWVDVTCDLVEVEWTQGASSGAGILSKAEAGVLTATLYDPTGKYDPFNPDSPYSLSGRSRLIPGRRVVAFAETIRDPTEDPPVTWQHYLFTGTVDEWSEEWENDPGERRAVLHASDATKNYVKLNRPEQPPEGAGDGIYDRLQRIVEYFDQPDIASFIADAGSTRTLQATTLAQSCWELLNRTVDDEIGFLYFAGDGILRYLPYSAWTFTSGPDPDVKIGCGPGFWDVATSATPTAFDANLLNTVYAARSGGTEQQAINATSVAQWGEHSYKRTDLGLETDALAAQWAADLVLLQAYPRQMIESLTLQPGVAGDQSWAAWFDCVIIGLLVERVQVRYANPRFGYTVDTTVRVAGARHRVTPRGWEVEWRTVAGNVAPSGTVFTLGPHPNDQLDAGNILT